jgi:hypothetical protein
MPAAASPTITTFHAPGAANTYAVSINAFGTVAGYYTKGVGALLQFDGNAIADPTHGRPDEGGYVQLMYKVNASTQLGGSWGISELKGGGAASGDGNNNSIAHLASYTVGWYHNMTKSLHAVVEGTKEINRYSGGPNRTDISAGLMLFF